MNVGERGKLKDREVKDISSRKNRFREKVEMEEYRKHVGEMNNRLVRLGIVSMGWRIRCVMQDLNDRVL